MMQGRAIGAGYKTSSTGALFSVICSRLYSCVGLHGALAEVELLGRIGGDCTCMTRLLGALLEKKLPRDRARYYAASAA